MGMDLIALLSLAWILAIAWCAASVIWRTVRHLLGRYVAASGDFAWPALGLFVLTAPLWAEAALLEVQCRNSGLSINAREAAPSEGIFWRSHVVDPNAYSAGIRLGSDSLRQSFVIASFKALAEGRLGYIEVPFGPLGDPATAETQKLYIATRTADLTNCVGGPIDSAWGLLPANQCVAWERAHNLNTRYEFTGALLEHFSDSSFAIKDRRTGADVSHYAFVKSIHANETLLQYWGLRSIQPRSCKPNMTDNSPAAHLLALTFSLPAGTAVQPPDHQERKVITPETTKSRMPKP